MAEVPRKSAITKKKRVLQKRAPRKKQLQPGSVSRIGQPDPRNPGQFFRREAYAASGSGNALRTGTVQAETIQASADAADAAKKIIELTVENQLLRKEVASLTSQQADAAAAQTLAVSTAQLLAHGSAASAINDAFQNGMNAAMRIMQKKEVKPSSYDFLKGKTKAATSRSVRSSESDDFE